jgi:hypothetical protein
MVRVRAGGGGDEAVIYPPVFIEALESRLLFDAIPQFPDLTPWASPQRGFLYGWTIDTSAMPGRTLLRLSSAVINMGQGPMELTGGPVNTDGTQQVYQKVFASDGSSKNFLCGSFIYHPQHNHVHFEDFTQYNLRIATSDGTVPDGEGAGVVATSSEKVSFCLLDSVQYSTSLPGAAFTAQYTTCTNVRQGISVGWADLYDKSLFGQWIDITDAPSGKYWLEVIVDPFNHMAESNERNNMARIAIDVHQNDNTRATAFDVGALSGGSAGTQTFNEFVGNADTVDYSKFTVSSNGTVSLNMTPNYLNADLYLLDSSGATVASSTRSGTLAESISRTLTPGTYYVRTNAVGGDSTYALGMTFTPVGGAASAGDNVTPPSGPAFERDGWFEDKNPRRGGPWQRVAEQVLAEDDADALIE